MKRNCSFLVMLAFLFAMLPVFIGMSADNAVLDVAKWAPERPACVVVIDLQSLKIKAGR